MSTLDTWNGQQATTGARLLWSASVRAGLGSGWTLAEAGLDSTDHAKLVAWLEGLTATSVSRSFRLEHVPLSHGPTEIRTSTAACFGLCLLAVASGLVRRSETASPGTVWPDFVGLVKALEQRVGGGRPAGFLTGGAHPDVSPAVRDALASAARDFGLLAPPEHLHQRAMHLISLHAGFFGRCETVASALRGQRTASQSQLVATSAGFARVWQALQALRAGQSSTEETRHALARSPWVLPDQVDPLLDQATSAAELDRAALGPRPGLDPTAEGPEAEPSPDGNASLGPSLVGRPRFMVLDDGRVEVRSTLLAAHAPAGVGTVDLIAEGQRIARFLRNGDHLSANEREITWPVVVRCLRGVIVSRQGADLGDVAYELWSDDQDGRDVVAVIDLATGCALLEAGPLPSRAALLVTAAALVTPTPRVSPLPGGLAVAVLPEGTAEATVSVDGVVVWRANALPPPLAVTGVHVAVEQPASSTSPQARLLVRHPRDVEVVAVRHRSVRAVPANDARSPAATTVALPVPPADARASTVVSVHVRTPAGPRVHRQSVALARGAVIEKQGVARWVVPGEEVDADERPRIRFLGTDDVPQAAESSLHPFLGLPDGVPATRPIDLHPERVVTSGAPLEAYRGRPPWVQLPARSTVICGAVVSRGRVVSFDVLEDGRLDLTLRREWEPPGDTHVAWLCADGTWGEADVAPGEDADDVLVVHDPRIRRGAVVATLLRVAGRRLGGHWAHDALERLPTSPRTFRQARLWGLPVALPAWRHVIERWAAESGPALHAAWLSNPGVGFDATGVTLPLVPGEFPDPSWHGLAPPIGLDADDHARWLRSLHALEPLLRWGDGSSARASQKALLGSLGQPTPGEPLAAQDGRPLAVRIGMQLDRVGAGSLTSFFLHLGGVEARAYLRHVGRERAAGWLARQPPTARTSLAALRADDAPSPLTASTDFARYRLHAEFPDP